jgi:peptide/nickel transport system permease protein
MTAPPKNSGGERGVVPPGRSSGGERGVVPPGRSSGRHAGAAVTGPPSAQELRAAGASWARTALRLVRANPLAAAGALIVLAVLVFCFLGPSFYHASTTRVQFTLADLSPRASHPLGTDSDGIDELAELMVGGRISLEVGLAAGVLAAVLGSLWGAVAGYFGGTADAIMMRIVDAAVAIPLIVLLLLIDSIYTPSTWTLMIVIAATSWLSTARLVRAEALTLRVREYVQVVRVMGGGSLRVVLRHVVPNAVGTITVNVSFQIANAILMLAALSYLGLGVQYPSVDWGDMIGLASQTIDSGYWWQIVVPGAAIVLVVVAFTMIGDGLRDAISGDAGGRRPRAGSGTV